MNSINVTAKIHVYMFDECTHSKKKLICAAKEATKNAYAPYSNFKVGAAILLADGKIITGNNQENAAYPSGLCAERVAIYHASSMHPNTPVIAIAVAAYNNGEYTSLPCTPCGSCRQSVLEVETRFNQRIAIIMYGEDKIYEADSISDLLPLSFGKTALDK